jgi:hypothetical protein
MIDLPTCSCRPFITVLVENGFFPTAPTQPNLAISIDFLEFYYALFEKSALHPTLNLGAAMTHSHPPHRTYCANEKGKMTITMKTLVVIERIDGVV